MNNAERTTATRPETEIDLPLGHVFVMTHSFFSDVVKIGCTQNDPETHVKSLSSKTIGEYSLAFSLQCSNACKVKNQIQKYLNAQEYASEFYQVAPEVAAKLLRRETLKIPNVIHLM